jgi:SAM-dependent methyltransferase
MSSRSLLDEVNAYYSNKVLEHGPTPRGVDWNSAQSQQLRFAQLLKIVDWSRPCVLGDFGCGYGSLFDYLESQQLACDYRGYDISEAMLAAARSRAGACFSSNEEILEGCDYIVASGIFNVRLQVSAADWKSYVLETIERLARYSSRGFAFNCLTSYSDQDRMRPDLYYADPCELFDYCKRRFSRNVALLHDYELYEFTLLVRTARQ